MTSDRQSSTHRPMSRQLNSKHQTTSCCCCSNSTETKAMERPSLKRRRTAPRRDSSPTLLQFTTLLSALPLSNARLRSSRRRTISSCLRYPSSPETVPSYLPSFSYQPSSLASLNGLIYECKPFPFNGWCGDYEPGNHAKPWGDAWILVGECLPGEASGTSDAAGDTMVENTNAAAAAAASSSTEASTALSSTESSPPEYTVDGLPPCSLNPPYSSEEIYLANDTLYSNGNIYKCKVAPADAWCSLGGYEPGSGMYWSMAWEEVGACFMDEVISSSSVESSPSSSSVGSSPAENGEGSLTSFSMEAVSTIDECAPLYLPTESYTTQSLVSYNQINYQCIISSWCSQETYAPYEGNTMTPAAWSTIGECEGIVTAPPSLAPVGPTDLPTEFPTEKPVEWIDINSEVSLEVVEEEGVPDALSFLVEPEQQEEQVDQVLDEQGQDNDAQEAFQIRTRRPSPPPTQEQNLLDLPPCEPLFTQGHEYQLKELMSFNGYNYRCEVPSECNRVENAPRVGQENQGLAWWIVEECFGEATRHPTPRPTPSREEMQPSGSDKVDVARNTYYASRVPMPILVVLNENQMQIQKKVLVSQTPNWDWEYSTLYTFDDFVVALGVLTDHPVISPFFLGGFGTQSSEEAVLYGLVNIAAFLSQAMAESIMFDTCDEANWDFVNNYYPLSNACGQGGLSYQDMTCSEEDAHMQCPVKKDMKVTAATSAKWLGGADGAPGPLYCAPKTSSQPYSGVWDHLYNCNRPHEDPPETCDVYEGQNAGRYDNSFPAGNSASRSDVEGCCWWGRGVIQTRGTCDIGKINHFLGKNAEDSPYPNLDFCEDPEALCASTQYKELKWVAGMASWTMRVQAYNQDGWGYIPELIKFVDGGMVDDSFIEAVSGILMRGCHDDSCGEIQPSFDRTRSFKMILDEVFGISELSVDAGRTFTPTAKPTRRTRKPVDDSPTAKPTRRTRKPVTPEPTIEVSTEIPSGKPTTQMPTELDAEPEPTYRPTEWNPWYYNYDTQTCVNDGKQPEWLLQADFFGIKDECCKKKEEADYDVCMGRVTYGWTAQNAKVEVADDEECTSSSTGWAASSDCHSYFMCQNGSRTGAIYDCADNFLFDEESTECKHQSEVNCGSNGSTMTIKSEILSEPKPTRRPTNRTRPPRPSRNTGRPTPTPYSSTVTHDNKPIASLWFGVSVTTKIKKEDDVDRGSPQG